VDANGMLRAELTNDRLHLMAEGYSIWVSIIKPYIDDVKKLKFSAN
jgi:lysophospholipase L1-like esterase